jgi:uncharacterized protein (TIGR02145 family)
MKSFFSKNILLGLKIMLAITLVGCKKEENANPNGQFTDTRDGKTYKTIQIGNQVWMAENLNYEIGGSWAYDNNPSNTIIYGRLYNWKTACNVCPNGWRLPSREEWEVMINYLGGDLPDKKSFVGRYLKEEGITHWEAPNTRANNSSGFTALPGGNNVGERFYDKGFQAEFWTSTEYISESMIQNNIPSWLAWSATLFYNSEIINIFTPGKDNGYSVRCIKN